MMSWGFFPSLRRQVTHTHTHTWMKWKVAITVNGVSGPGMDGGVCEVEFPLSRSWGDNMAGNGDGA